LNLRLLATPLRKLAERPGVRAVLANSSWVIADRVARMLLAVLVGAWVARHLGPERNGELAYVVAVVALWQTLASLGLPSIVVRDLAKEPHSTSGILGSARGLRLPAAIVCWGGSVLTVWLAKPDDTQALLIATVLSTGLLFQVSDLIDQWYQSRMLRGRSIPLRIGVYVLAAAVKVAMIFADAPLWGFALALLCETVLIAGAMAWIYWRDSLHAAWQFHRGTALRLLRDSWPMLIATLSITIYMRIDQLILQLRAGDAQLGLYSAVLPISSAFHIVATALCASLLPRISQIKLADPQLYMRRLQQLFTFMAWAGIATSALLAAIAPLVVHLLLGPSYTDAVPVLRWHSVTNIFIFLGVAQSVALISDNTPRIVLYRTVLGAVVSVAANWFLASRWGAIGTAWAAIAAQSVAAMLSNALVAPSHLRMQLRAFWPYYSQRP
jgi:O-antigen/teichoic acid export membrane protein